MEQPAQQPTGQLVERTQSVLAGRGLMVDERQQHMNMLGEGIGLEVVAPEDKALSGDMHDALTRNPNGQPAQGQPTQSSPPADAREVTASPPGQPTPSPPVDFKGPVNSPPPYQAQTTNSNQANGEEAGFPAPPPPSPPRSLPRAPSGGTEDSTTARPSGQGSQGLPGLDYKLYSPPMFELSEDCTTITSKAAYLTTKPSTLAKFIRAQATVPPKPQVQVRGTRRNKVDFDIKLNLMTLLVPQDASQRMDYLRCVTEGELAYRGGTKQDVIPEVGVDTGDNTGGLDEWCQRFIEDPAPLKSFTMNRVVANLDTTWIDGQLRGLIAATSYKGAVTITFPVTHARVVVGQEATRGAKLMGSMTKMFNGGKRRYEVVQAVWPFATAKLGEAGRKCMVQSEEVWWKEWRDPIKYAIASKRHGWVTNEDKLEALMEGKGRGVKLVDWGDDYDVEQA